MSRTREGAGGLGMDGWGKKRALVLVGEDDCVMGCEGRTVFCQLLLSDKAEFVLIVFLLFFHAANLCNV